MLSRRRLLASAAASLAAAGLAGCGADAATPPLRLLVPNAPGGGYDTTARLLAGAIAQVPGADVVDVFNLPGGSGTAGLARLSREHGDAALLMMMGLGVVGATAVAGTPEALAEATPVARLIAEPELVLVRADSPVRRFDQFADRWRAQPAGVRIGGGSLAGGPDHLATYDLAAELGVPAGDVRYRRYDGGGPLLAALLDGDVDVVLTGVLESLSQVNAGSVRALAVTGPTRVPGLEVPTLREEGVDASFENWRGVLTPPGLGSEERDRLVDLVRDATRTPVWADAVRTNGWTEAWLDGDDFGAYVAAEQQRTEALLRRLPTARATG